MERTGKDQESAVGCAKVSIPGELQRLAIFIALPLFGLAVSALFFQFILAQGPAGGLDQAGVHGNALVDARGLKN